MANLAVFASGNGSNFQVIAQALKSTSHSLEFLLCNKKSAFALERAHNLGIPSYVVSYLNKDRKQVEQEILEYTGKHKIDLIALAGYMKMLTPFFIDNFKGYILNIHPSLLPKHPGVNSIERSYNAGDKSMGISIIKIDNGVDTGPILLQESFEHTHELTLDQAEKKVHELEHKYFPMIVIQELDKIEAK